MPQSVWVLLASVAGLVGALTGLTALALQVWQFQLSGPRVKVRVAEGFLTSSGRWALVLEVANIGRLPCTVTSVGVEIPSKHHIPIGGINRANYLGPELPLRIDGGHAEQWMIDPHWILMAFQDLSARPVVRGRATLATGSTKTSKTQKDVARLASFDDL